MTVGSYLPPLSGFCGVLLILTDLLQPNPGPTLRIRKRIPAPATPDVVLSCNVSATSTKSKQRLTPI